MNKKPQAEKTVCINISLPPDDSERIRKVCRGLDKSLSQFFREAAECYLRHLNLETPRSLVLDPMMIAKAHTHMISIRRYAKELQEVMKNVKNQCGEL
jgi:hypothetical protein